MDIVNLEPGAQRLADLVARVGDGELARPTPCPAYTLGDLIDHVGGLALAFTAAAKKDSGSHSDRGPSGDASRLGDGWRTRIPRDLQTLVRAWQEPGAWTGMSRIAGMDAPAAMVGLTLADELVVHGWDVARATGQPYGCEPGLLAAARTFLLQITSPDAPAGPDVPFGPPPAGARRRAVARSGRRPRRARPRLVTQLTQRALFASALQAWSA
jgi:uncharacterized protein (TIGR03086 family)